MAEVTLFTIPGSHPGVAVRAMLRRKGIEFKRVDLMPVISKGVVRALGFPGPTVPAARFGGRRVQGSREIARELDRLAPEPPLFPAEPDARVQVELAERFGDEDLQHPVRQILWWGLRRRREAMASYAEGAKLGLPVGLAVKAGGPVVAAAAKLNRADDENVRAGLMALSGFLDRIDGWIGAGVLGGEEPNAADFQIGASVRLAMSLDDLRPAIEARPAGEMAMRAIPDYPGRMPPVLPPAWLRQAGL